MRWTAVDWPWEVVTKLRAYHEYIAQNENRCKLFAKHSIPKMKFYTYGNCKIIHSIGNLEFDFLMPIITMNSLSLSIDFFNEQRHSNLQQKIWPKRWDLIECLHSREMPWMSSDAVTRCWRASRVSDSLDMEYVLEVTVIRDQTDYF
jgi:hypothetical protein